jgi:Ca2+-binding RTX toxin-like protein
MVLDVNAGNIKLSLDKMPPGRMLKLQALNGGSLAGFNLQIIAPRGSSVDPAQLFDFGGSEPPGLDVVYDYGAPEGTGGNDFLVGTSNADLLEGLGGDDTLAGGPGADRLDGGPGSDWYAATAEGSSFAAISAGLFIDLPGGAATDPWGGADEISGISNVIGTDLADTFVGDDQSNILAAGGGDDSIEAGGGDDVVTAGGGSDTVDAAQGNDTVFGEAGNDTLDGGDGDDLLSGGSGRDDLDGGDGRDVLLGGDDDDYLHGNGGDDELYGGDGGDTLVGGENELDEDFTEQAVSSALDVGRALQAADFNNDGFQDLVYADEDFDVVGVHLNDGAGGFGPLILVDGSANGAHDVAVADVDGDGNADIAAAALYASRIYLYKGNGDGTFSPAQEISTMNGPYSLDSADVDGDGDMDLLTASWHSNNASLLQNNGDGTWTRSAVGNSGGRPVSLVAADLDGDGDLDALSAFMETNAIKWSMNTGGGVYGGWQLISNEVVDATDAKAADLDGDGDPDVVASSSGDDKVFWFENLGSGSFGPRKLISGEAENVRSVEAVDMDGDGDLDVLSASYDDGKLAWYENLGSGEFGPQQVIGSWAWLNDLIAADLDGDGDPDPAAVSENNLAVYYNNLAGRNDSLYGGAGDDSLTGNGGDDELYGGDGGDTLVGGFGADSLDGGFGADSLVGGAGNDTVAVENGSDYYDGGAGMDVLSFEFLGSVTFTLGAGGNGGISILESTQTYSGFEGLAGSSENDNLRGNSGDNVLFGGDGDDILFGFDGNDTLFGGAGVDSLYGGDGWDVVDYSLSDGPVKVDLMANDAETSSGTESFYSIEHAIGSDYDDSLIGNESGNSLFGGAGNDTLVVVGDQENVLSGGEGDDVIMIDRVGTDVANLVTDFDDGDGFAINAVNGAFTDPAFTTTQNESGGYLRVLIPRTSQILVDVSFNTFSYVTTTVFGGTSVIFSSVSTPIYDTHYGFSLSKVGSGSIPHLWTQNSWDRAVNGANSNFTMAETGVGFINTEGYLAAAFFKSDSEAWAVTKVESIATFSNGVDHTELEAADIFLY